MVVVMNTLLEKDEDDKDINVVSSWKFIVERHGKLIDYFSEYAASKARHAYGPNGHRGMSVLIFDGSDVGYVEAERLHRHFIDQRTDRDSWQNHRVRFLPGGKRQLYGKARLKYEMRSYNEMVVAQMKQMSEDNQQLNYLKNRMVKKEQHSKLVEETLGVVTQKLRETMEENNIVRKKATEKHLEYENVMKFQEKFFHDQIERIHKATDEKESRKEAIQKSIDCQVKDVEKFEAERDKLIKSHEETKVKLKMEYMAKEVELEKKLDAALTSLMDKHKPDAFQGSCSSSS
uniref:XS domain-containing protein n=1 Tax=Leersia perrieri TaxID=77586 RepID=A0A0D9XSR4_9ORYZ